MAGLNFSTSPSLELVKTALDDLRDNTLIEEAVVDKAVATDPIVFAQQSADKAAVVTSVMGGGGYFKKTITGVAQDVTAKKQATKNVPSPKTTIIAEFNKDVPISRSFMMDQQHEAVAKAIRQETLSWVASRDQNAFNYYAFGFGTTLSTCIDSVALYSNSHVNANGDTVDNLETGVLTDANVNILVNSLRTQKNQGGVVIGWEPKFLLTSSILHHDAKIVTKSVLRAGTGNNDLNYFSETYGGMKVVYSPFIDGSGASSATTQYHIGGSMHGVVRYEREAFFSELVDWKTDADDLYKYKLRAREEVDTIEYTGNAGSNGTV